MDAWCPVRVVVADDHPVYREGVCAALARSSEVEVVGAAADGAGLVELVARTRPDVVLTDVTMPVLDGPGAIREILAADHAPAFLLLTMHSDDETLFAALRAGARGYLLKGADRVEITRAVLAVAAGQAVYSAAVAMRLVEVARRAPRATAPAVLPELTARERQILDLVATGRRNDEIAGLLVISEKTVRNHVSAILFKLQVRDRAAAVARARDVGLGRPPTAVPSMR